MDTLEERERELASGVELSAIRRQHWVDTVLSVGMIGLFGWLASTGPYAGKSIYFCLILLNIVYLSGQLRLARRVALLSQKCATPANAAQATPPQTDSHA